MPGDVFDALLGFIARGFNRNGEAWAPEIALGVRPT
jgi:hypothetical protein